MNINIHFVRVFFGEDERFHALPFVAARLLETLIVFWEQDFELDEQNERFVRPSVPELTEMCEISQALVNRLITKLTQTGVIRRVRGESGKSMRIYLTISDDFRERLISARTSVPIDNDMPQSKEWELRIRGYGEVMANIANVVLQPSREN